MPHHARPIVIYDESSTAAAPIAAEVDSVNKALIVQNSIHEKIHDGALFTASRFVDAVGDNLEIRIHIVTAAARVAHMRIRVGGKNAVELALHETAVVSGDEEGTAITAYNRLRSSAATAVTSILHTPEFSDDGTLLLNTVARDNFSSFEEWDLAGGTDYQVIATNRSGAAQPMSVVLDWYEPV